MRFAPLLLLAVACAPGPVDLSDGGLPPSDGGLTQSLDAGCTPRTCAPGACGSVADGCGQTLDCGGCTNGQTCGGQGTPNVCGAGTCTPKTCAQLGCGQQSDGCAAMLDCGACGPPCDSSRCPPGFTCNAQGACAGGDLGNLRFDLAPPKVVKVSGRITEGGQRPPLDVGNCRVAHFIRLSADGGQGEATATPVPCEGGDPYTYAAFIAPGEYRVVVSSPEPAADDLSLGSQPYAHEAIARLRIASDYPNLELPLPKRLVVRVAITQGGQPTTGRFSYSLESARGTAYGTGTAESYPYAGDYTLKLNHYGNAVVKRHTFPVRAITTSGTHTFDLPFRTWRLKGTVLIDGKPPAYQYTGCGTVTFQPAGVEVEQSIPITCTGGQATFDGSFVGGTGPLEVKLYSIPRTVSLAYVHTADQLAAVFDLPSVRPPPNPATVVSGTVRKQGQALAALPGGATERCGTLLFTSTTLPRTSVYADVTCAWTFAQAMPAGSYTATVTWDDQAAANAFGAQTARSQVLTLTPGRSHVVDLEPVVKVAIGGYLTVKGQRPIQSTSGSSLCGSVVLEPLSGGTATYLSYDCDGADAFTFSGQVEKGAYRVLISSSSNAGTNVPSGRYVVRERLELQSNDTGVRLEVGDGLAVYVAGDVQLNHGPPPVAPMLGCGTVRFTAIGVGYDTTFPLKCAGQTSAFTFAGRLPAGVYQVTSTFPLPRIWDVAFSSGYVLVDRLVVTPPP